MNLYSTNFIVSNLFPNPVAPSTSFIPNIIAYETANPSASDAYVVSQVSSEITHIIYVNQNATGSTHDGSSWADAFLTVQAALNAAAATPGEDQIWVTQGNYSLSPPGATNLIPAGVAIFGGFVGNETSLSQRPNATTTLSGGSNIFNIVTMINGAAILDGFSMANVTAFDGTGVGLSNSSLLIFNSTFTALHASRRWRSHRCLW